MKASFWIVKSFPLILKSNWCIKWVLTLQDGCQLPEYLQTIQSCKADRHFLPLILKSMTAGIVLTWRDASILIAEQRRRKPVQIGCRLHGSAKRPSACKRSGAAGRRNLYRAVADAFGVFLVSCCGCTVRRSADRLVYLLLFA